MKSLVLIFFFIINLNAYCITNNTNKNIYFMVEFYQNKDDSVLTFKKYIKPKTTSCCKANNKKCNLNVDEDVKLSFYAFLNENSLEGCDVFGKIDSNITLDAYKVFDNCIWK